MSSPSDSPAIVSPLPESPQPPKASSSGGMDSLPMGTLSRIRQLQEQAGRERSRGEASTFRASIPKNSPSEDELARRAEAAEAHRAQQAERDARQRDARIKSLWAAADVPLRHADHVDLRATGTGQWAEKYASLKGRMSDGFLAALLGQRGVGKTQMAVCLIRDACEVGMSAKYIKALDLFRDLRSCYRDDGPDEKAVVKTYRDFGLLIIDEAHERGHTEFEDRTLVNIVDHRYDAMKSTLLLSNHDKAGFVKSVGPSIVSRLLETGEAVDCDWPSFRPTSAGRAKP
jgi:DNA replication protein DnaC